MQSRLFGSICAFSLLLTACGTTSSVPTPTDNSTPQTQVEVPTPSNVDMARAALTMFFGSLYRGEYQTAASYYGGSYYGLRSLYPDVDSQDHAALLKSACEGSRYHFYCWKLKDVVEQRQISPGKYVLIVRFEDENGNLLTGGDNRTPVPCLPSEDCPRSQYVYTVLKVEDDFLVQELPVCVGCWP